MQTTGQPLLDHTTLWNAVVGHRDHAVVGRVHSGPYATDAVVVVDEVVRVGRVDGVDDPVQTETLWVVVTALGGRRTVPFTDGDWWVGRRPEPPPIPVRRPAPA